MELLTLVLVDDEPIILKGLRETYQWEKMGYRIVGTARNGKEALALLEEKRPDLVLTDIHMKNMNGLMLIEQAKEKKLPTDFVVVSAYRDFEYAKKACEIGALSYLVKPFEEEELEAAMKTIYESCTAKKMKEKNYDLWQNLLLEDRENFLNQMISRYLEDGIEEEELKNLFISLSREEIITAAYLVVAADIDIAERIVNQKEYDRKKQLLDLLLYKTLKEQYVVWYKQSPEQIPCYIVLIKEKTQITAIKELLKELKKQMSTGLISVISNIEKGLCGIKKAYTQVVQLFKIASEAEVFLLTRNQESKLKVKAQYSIEIESQIINAVKKNLEEQLKEAYKKFIFSLPREEEQARIYMHRLAVRVEFALMDSNGMSEDCRDRFFNFYRISHDITGVKLVNILYQLLLNVIRHRRENDRQPGEEYFKEYITQAVAYIEEHLHEESLSITDVSESIYLNPVYFGRVFKNIMGMSFKRYVQNLRIEHAKELILQEELSIAVLCIKVGIPNPSYFSQLFKQYTGVLPSEYKRSRMDES